MAVLQAYQNAINKRGAAFGDRNAGPTISNYATVSRKRNWYMPARVAGELWQSPELPVKSGYGDTVQKSKDIAAIESHFQMPLSQFWKIEKLRPEDAYFIPAAVLRSLVGIIMNFPTVQYDEFYKLMLQEKKESRRSGRNTKSNFWFNITEANITNVHKKLQRTQDQTTSQPQTLGNDATSQGFDKRSRSLSPKLSSKKLRKMPRTTSTGHATGPNPSTSQAQSSAARQEAKEKIEKLRLEKREGAQRIKTLEDEVSKITERQKEIDEEIEGLKRASK